MQSKILYMKSDPDFFCVIQITDQSIIFSQLSIKDKDINLLHQDKVIQSFAFFLFFKVHHS